MATPIKWGTDFLVNTITGGAPSEPVITALANGKFVATWGDGSHTLGDSDVAIHAQLFDADGSKAGAEFLVNTTTIGAQIEPHVAAFADGHFVAMWTDYFVGYIRAQVFNSDGSKSGTELLVTASAAQFDSGTASITTLADGRFVATWGEGSGFDIDVHGQVFNSDGTQSGGELILNTTVTGSQLMPAITGLSDGRFVATWEDDSQGNLDIRGQIFNADGSKSGSEFIANPSNGHEDSAPAITALAGGRSWCRGMTMRTSARKFSIPTAANRARSFT
jgi:hypothetical protein